MVLIMEILRGLFHGKSLGCTNGKLYGCDEGVKIGFLYGKVLGTILGSVDGISIGLDVGLQLRYLYGVFDHFNDRKIKGLLFGDSLEYNDGKVLGSDECIKLIYTNCNGIGSILVNVDVIILWIDVGAQLGFLYGAFNDSYDGKLVGLLFRGLLGSTDGKVLGSDEDMKQGHTDDKVLGTIF